MRWRPAEGDAAPGLAVRMAWASLYILTALSIGRAQELFAFLTPLRIVFVTGSVCIVLTLLVRRGERQPVLAQREVRIVMVLAGFGLLMVPFGVWPGGSLSFLQETYSKLLVLFILVITLATNARVIRNLVWSVMCGVGLLGTFTLLEPSFKTAREYAMGRAYASTTYDPNDVAMVMVCTLPLAAFGALALRGVARLAAASVAMICVLATVMTVSRGGFIGLAVVCVILMLRIGVTGTRFLALALIIVLIVVLLVVSAPAQYWRVMETIWSPTGTGYVERGVFTRMELWMRGVDILLQNPVTGVGIGMYGIADGLVYGRRGGGGTAHNSFIQLGAELGLVGLTLFVVLLILSVQNARRALRAAKANPGLQELEWMAAAVETSLYAYVVVGFALSQAYSAMLYFLVGIATALRLAVKHRYAIASSPDASTRARAAADADQTRRRLRRGAGSRER